ncbi:MAG: lysostaphin resistance A-like protein [Planctomycetota bacterium]|jgi:membrane protease YdiL (CAAX protease family)
MTDDPDPARKSPTPPWGPEAAFLFIAVDFSIYLFLPHEWSIPVRFGLAGAFTLALRLFWKAPASLMGFRLGSLREGVRVCGITIAVTVVLLGAGAGLFFLLRAFGVPLALPPPSKASWPAIWRAGLLTVLLYPVLEEWIYRGILFPPLEERTGRVSAILLSGLVFQALHLAYGIWLPHYFVGGMLLAWGFMRTRSLLYPIFLHALWNAFIIGFDAVRGAGWIGI